jgi:formylglycine-generating enzyme required for sulfatase activity
MRGFLVKTLAGSLALGVVVISVYLWSNSGTRAVLAGTGQGCTLQAPDSPYPGMIWVPGSTFTMGGELAYAEEGPMHKVAVAGFWMDQTEVTNAQFAEFVAATGYQTLAERGITDPIDSSVPPRKGSAVFDPSRSVENANLSWWQFVDGASWRHPHGPNSTIEGLEQHPVVHIAFEDAEAYARWNKRSLPTEAQFEFAAQSSSRKNPDGEHISNTWQGFFPFQHDSLDGYTSTAPVGCYTANELGLHDLIGNVWEWTASAYYPAHDFRDKTSAPEGFDPQQPEETAVAVIKGGSYLCAPNYCMRYRPEARQGQSKGLGTSHIGFRTVLNATNGGT